LLDEEQLCKVYAEGIRGHDMMGGVMFLSDEERKKMDGADWRFYHYKIKKMDVLAQRMLPCCIAILGLMVPALALMPHDNVWAAIFFGVSSSAFIIPVLKTAWWFFDDRKELRILREAKAKKECKASVSMNGRS
jgi:hypothetical protein